MSAPLIKSPTRPDRHWILPTASGGLATLDAVLAVLSAVGIVAWSAGVVEGLRQASRPDSDGLEMLGVFFGVACLLFLVPALALLVIGLRFDRQGPRVSGRVLFVASVLGWPPIPPMVVTFVLLWLADLFL